MDQKVVRRSKDDPVTSIANAFRDALKAAVKGKYSGQIIVRVPMNGGGIRGVKIRQESEENLIK